MKPAPGSCAQAELVSAYALHALSSAEVRAVEAHLGTCAHCRAELQNLRPVVDSFGAWPRDVLSAPASLQRELASRLAAETGHRVEPNDRPWTGPEWEKVAPGIECQLISDDAERHIVTMLVRLAPGAEYPPHTHAGTEELHLLDGELWIDERKLRPGDYNRAEAGTGDKRVWSETGCTCVLITSTRDILR